MSATANAATATTLIETFVTMGTKHVVVSPGSRSTPIVLACSEHPEIQTHTVLDERAAGFIGLGLARADQSPVVLVCTSGSAGAHYLPAVIEANYSGIPLVVITADRPSELHHCGANQTVNQTGFFVNQTRFYADIAAPGAHSSAKFVRTIAAQAINAATGSSPGPVHLNVHFRKPLWSTETGTKPAISPARISAMSPQAPLPELNALSAQLNATERGIIVCGPELHDPQFSKAVIQLAEKLQWPVLADATSNVRFGNPVQTHLISSYDACLRSQTFAKAMAPELIVRFGKSPTSAILVNWLAEHGEDNTILVDAHGRWHDPSHAANVLIQSDPTALCEAVDVTPRTDATWLAQWQHAERIVTASLGASCDDTLWEGSIAKSLINHLPNGAALHVASSMPIRDIDGFTTPTPRNIHVFASRGANGIDGTVATAVGESMAWAQGPTACFLGDLSLHHDIDGLLAGCQLGARVTLVVVDNNGGGIFGFLPIAEHDTAFEPYFVTPQNADIEALCRATGAQFQWVESLSEFGRAFQEDLERPGIGVIGIRVNRQANIDAHHHAWTEAVSALENTL